MLVKFFSRGKGGGSGPVDYLLGKDRDRKDAQVLRGDTEQVKQLIDGLSFSRNYTSGCLSFAEKNIPEHQKQQLMDSFQDTLMAGLDRNQYDILWVEHKDKDRLELNFLIPNVELSTSKRLQPYYDKNDRHYVNAWQQIANATFKFKDPHDPANKRFSVTAKDLPNDRKQAVSLITNSLVNEVSLGAIANRDDVINKLQSYGLEIARQTKSSISVKDPNGGKNIRLKGALYERNFKSSADVEEKITRAIESYRASSKERLSEFKATFAKSHKAKRKANHERYRQHGRESTRTPDEHNVQRITGVSSWSDIWNGNHSRSICRPVEIRHNKISDRLNKYERHSKTASVSNKNTREEIRDTTIRTSNAIERLTNAIERYATTIINACGICREQLAKRRDRDQKNSMTFGR